MEACEDRTAPAVFGVTLLSPAVGEPGETAAAHAGELRLIPPHLRDTDVVEAATPEDAVRLTLTGTITATVGSQSASYAFGPDTVDESKHDRLPYLVRLSGTAGRVWLEDMAGLPNSDWDYNDRSWRVSVRVLNASSSGGGGSVFTLSSYPQPVATAETMWYPAMAEGPDQIRLRQTVTQVSDTAYRWAFEFANTSTDSGSPISFYNLGVGKLDLGALDLDDIYGHEIPAGWKATEVSFDAGVYGPTVRWETAGDVIMPGQSRTFVFYSEPRSFTWAPGLGYAPDPGGISAVGAGIVPGKSSVDLDIEGLDDPTEMIAPGKKIHINDNFDEGQQTATKFVSDNLPDPATGQNKITPADTDLANGTLTIDFPGQPWTLRWLIDPSVKVWYKEWAGPNTGKWIDVPSSSTWSVVAPPPLTIELKIEGIEVGEGTITVELLTGVPGNPKVTDTVAYTVFTGLRINGPYEGMFRGQVATVSAWTLTSDISGNVWRTGANKGEQAWQRDVRGYLDPIFRSEKKQVVVSAVHDKAVQVGSFATSRVDPFDLAVFFAFEERLGSALVVHELVEQYEKQVNSVTDFAVAHKIAREAEAKVYVGSGTRDEVITGPIGTVYHIMWRYAGGVIVEHDVDISMDTNISNVMKP